MPPTPKPGSLKKVATATVKKAIANKVVKPTANKIVKATADSTAYYTNKSNNLFKQSTTLLNKPYPLQPSNDNITTRSKKANQLSAAAIKAQNDALRQSRKGKLGYDKNGFPIKKSKVGGTVKSKKK